LQTIFKLCNTSFFTALVAVAVNANNGTMNNTTIITIIEKKVKENKKTKNDYLVANDVSTHPNLCTLVENHDPIEKLKRMIEMKNN